MARVDTARKMTALFALLVESARAGIDLLHDDEGSMPPGHNGPYHDQETAVRNTGHWLITFLKAYEVSGNTQFREAALRALNYLHSNSARPMEATFWHRKNPKKDFCNGLIGQAWSIEALAVAADALEDDDSQALAEEVFLLHPFDNETGLWRRVNVDGSYFTIDSTFNHQLWFAAAGALLLPRHEASVAERVTRFMDTLPDNLTLYPSGLIRHPLTRQQLHPVGRRAQLRTFLGDLLGTEKPQPNRDGLYHKSIGYHAFNLYAFALLKERLPNHPFWHSRQVKQMLAYVDSDGFVSGLEGNKYGYPYNPAGFEVAYALEVFLGDNLTQQERWVSEQLRRCYDWDSHMMSRGTEDPVTHAARVYEATRLPDLKLYLEGSV